MIKKFFKSAVPAIMALCVGALVFIAGNFFAEFFPETWLEPMAWVSSVALCVGLVLGAVAYGMYAGPWGMIFSCVVLVGGGMLAFLWLLMALFGIVNYDFVDTNIFCHPTMGGLSVGIFGMGASVLSRDFKKRESPWRWLYVTLCGVLLVSFGFIFAGRFWILPLSEKAMAIFALIGGISFVGMLGMIILAAFSKKLNYL